MSFVCAFKYTIQIQMQVLTSSTSLLLSLWTSQNRTEYNKLVCLSTIQLWFYVATRRLSRNFSSCRMEIHTIGCVCARARWCWVFLFGYISIVPGLDGCIQHLNVTYGFQALRLNIFESIVYTMEGWQWKSQHNQTDLPPDASFMQLSYHNSPIG